MPNAIVYILPLVLLFACNGERHRDTLKPGTADSISIQDLNLDEMLNGTWIPAQLYHRLRDSCRTTDTASGESFGITIRFIEPTRGVLTIPGEIVFTYEFLPGDIKLSGDSLLNCRTLAGSLGQYVDFDLDLRSRQLVVNSGPIPVMNQKLFAKASGAVPASRTLREWAIYLHLYKRKYRMRETNSTEFMDVLTVHDGNTKILLPNKKSIYIQHQRSIPGVNCERKMKAMLEFDEAKDPDWVEYTVHFKNNGSIAFSATGENVNSKIKDFILHPLD